MTQKPQNAGHAPHWLYAETASRARADIDREWDELLAAETPASDDVARLSRAMMALRAERPARPLLAASNARALRWVDRKLRESRAAARLRTARPDLPLRSRLRLRWLALSGPALACVVALMVHVRLTSALHHVHRAGQRIAAIHFDRHVGPMA